MPNFFGRMKRKFTSFQIIILGFVGVILLGALILMLPIASSSNSVTPFLKTLFTATSAVCVTGLVVVDTASHWSAFGQAVILILIQIGGMGVITVATFLAVVSGKKISLAQRQTIQNSISATHVGGVVRFIRFIVRTVICIEFTGALLLLPLFCQKYGLRGIWLSFFHSISAFCNAGFDLMGNITGEYTSLTSFSDNIYLTFVISFLILAGGLGFFTWSDIVTKKFRFKEYKMQSKVILVMTAILVVVPTLIFFMNDFSHMSLQQRFCEALFQAVTPRTAGFNTADYAKMTGAGRGITVILMLVGGAPGSTAGGMKITTIAVLFANSVAVFCKRASASFFGRRIEDSAVKLASTILFMYVLLSVGGALLISFLEKLPVSDCLFETVSAIATVGLSLGLTPSLGAVSHCMLIMLMFMGRVGGLTLIYAAFSHKEAVSSKYPVESIMVG